jgi:hypothetical protein
MNETETKFSAQAIKRDYKVVHADSYQDRIEHWDFIIQKNGFPITVEVKGQKRINRHDMHPQCEWIWIELVGITGHNGWLYGKSDVIAFETDYGFLLVNRKKLIEIVDKKVNHKEYVDCSWDAKYKVYQRFGRDDMLTLINRSDIEEIKHIKWIAK